MIFKVEFSCRFQSQGSLIAQYFNKALNFVFLNYLLYFDEKICEKRLQTSNIYDFILNITIVNIIIDIMIIAI